ncbi:coiled-coil alpha-helical rod protein 1 [Polypterus senegalus]|uniref:coiled-coil alpha-helical rod protein 1 n=1 Tax=Polypterus senegalus TaxID=55291 RepID=UPI001964D750|nr:coiled-coil alpha-helical rod protein 1 [Polypterus senegalus]
MDVKKTTSEKLNPPTAFCAPSKTGTDSQEGLVPPSHFTSRTCSTSVLDNVLGGGESRSVPLWKMIPSDLQQSSVVLNPWIADPLEQTAILDVQNDTRTLKTQQRKDLKPMFTIPNERCHRARSLDREGETEIYQLPLAPADHTLFSELEFLRKETRRQAADLKERGSILSRLQDQVEDLQSELAKSRQERDRLCIKEERLKFQHQTELKRLIWEKEETNTELERIQLELKRLTAQRDSELERLHIEVEQAQMELEGVSQKHHDEIMRVIEEEKWKSEEADKGRRREIAQIQEQLQENTRQHKTELNCVLEKYATEVAELTKTKKTLKEELDIAKQEMNCLKEQVKLANSECDKLKEELSTSSSALHSQTSLVQSLRTYIGKRLPEQEKHDCEIKTRELSNTVQVLENERESLRMTAELLNVRLNSLSDILVIQEKEIGKKVLLDPLTGSGFKGQELLRRWREKVFQLLVQIRSQGIEYHSTQKHLHSNISELEERINTEEHNKAVLHHSLQDKVAELEMERVKNGLLNSEMVRVQAEAQELKVRAEEAENAVLLLKDSVTVFWQTFLEVESKMISSDCCLLTLGQRVTFASKRIDTIHGLMMRKEALLRLQFKSENRAVEPDPARKTYADLQNELLLMNEERDRLALELKRSPQLIEKALLEARRQFQIDLKNVQDALQESRETENQLMEQLKYTQARHKEAEDQLSALKLQLQEATESSEKLIEDIAQQQEQHERDLQGKLSEVEGMWQQQLRDLESKLNCAQREHTKAVVALRQVERHFAREKERLQDLQRLQEEQKAKEIQDLQKALRESERDVTLLTATLRQQGLINQYRKTRSPSLQPSDPVKEVQPDRSSCEQQTSQLTAHQLSKESKESLLSKIDEIQSLYQTVMVDKNSSEEEGDTDS